MWCATMALNTLIGKGVIPDWSSHMIANELTVVYGLDHAQTLAIILPNVMEYKKEKKADKIIQYAERVLNLDVNLSQDQKIKQALEKTRDFFELMGNPTSLKDYNVDLEMLPKIIGNLKENGLVALGEHQDIALSDSKKILSMCL